MRAVYLVPLVSTLLISACAKEGEKPKEENASAGESIVKANCKVCHAQGINGAPVIGNKKMWGPRLEKGIPTLVTNASNGFGLMPAKGGNTSLTTEEMTLAVEYMVSKVK